MSRPERKLTEKPDSLNQEKPPRRTSRRVIELARRIDDLIHEQATEIAHELFFQATRKVAEERLASIPIPRIEKRSSQYIDAMESWT